MKRKASGKHQAYENKIKDKRKADIDAKKAAIRAEDIAKGVFVPVCNLPRAEPKVATPKGGLVPTLNGEQLKNAACSGSFPSEIIVETRDVVKLNSSALTLQSLMEIRKAVIECDNDAYLRSKK